MLQWPVGIRGPETLICPSHTGLLLTTFHPPLSRAASVASRSAASWASCSTMPSATGPLAPFFSSHRAGEGPAEIEKGNFPRLRNQAGVPRDLALSLARHECGTKICREKGIEYARRLLGHSNISTTQRYMHLDDRELADAQDLVE